ncbi:MAG: hypothetical protein WC570_01005 [Patescibacteria group bacterium]
MKSIYQKIKSILSDDSGSAIIMALIIIAGLAGTGLGAARLSRSNISQTNQFEDSLKAFYAAEAGVEAALLEWRFDHDVEFWDQQAANDCYDSGGTDVDRCAAATPAHYVTLDDQTSAFMGQDLVRNLSETEVEAGVVPKNQAWYELRIYYRDPKNPFLGNYNGFNPAVDKEVRINKDETLEIRFPEKDEVKGFSLRWAPDGIVTGSDEFVQLMVHPVAKDVDTGDTDLVSPRGKEYFTDKNWRNNQQGALYNIENVSSLGTGNYDYVYSLRVKCLTNNESGSAVVALWAFDGANNPIHVPLDFITIESVGHYNDVERKVVYEIDRESGTIMDIFDHGVFSEQTLRK